MGIKSGSILFFICFLIFGFKNVSALQCPQNTLNFHISIFSNSNPSYCSLYWNMGYILNGHKETLFFHDKYFNHLQNEQEQYDYCVRKERLYIHFDFSNECYQQGYMEIHVQDTFLETIPFESHPINLNYYLDQSISFSYSYLEWKVDDIPLIHSFVFYSNKTGCIIFASKEICLIEKQEYFLPPSQFQSIQIINQDHLSLFILPLYHHPSHPYSYRSFHLPIEYQEEHQLCHITFTFPSRQEWVNALLLNSSLVQSSTVYMYTIEKENLHQFIDAFQISSSSFIRFGYFRQFPYSNLHLLFTQYQSCTSLASSIQLLSYPSIRLFPGMFVYYNQEPVRIQLPCALVYSYRLKSQKRKKNAKKTPLTIRSSGLLVGKPLAYQSFVVVGNYTNEQSILTQYSIYPPEVSIPMSVYHSDCSSEYILRVLIELTNERIGYSRFYIISPNQQLLMYMEIHPHGHTASRSYCAGESSFSFINSDCASGKVTILIGDFSLYSTTFTSDQYYILLHVPPLMISSLHKKKDPYLYSGFSFFNAIYNHQFLNALIFSPTLQSISIANHVIFNKTLANYSSSFVHFLTPIPVDVNDMYLEYLPYNQKKYTDHVHTIIHSNYHYDSHILAVSLFNTTLFITPQHHELFCINAIYFDSIESIPPFTMFLLIDGHWQDIGNYQGNMTLYPIPLLLQLANEKPSLQYQIQFDYPPEKIPDISFGYEPSEIWKNHDYLTPGFHITVFKDCYNWIPFGKNITATPIHSLILQYNLYFDWNNEVLFGTALSSTSFSIYKVEILEEDAWERMVENRKTNDFSDSVLISSHIQLIECYSSSIKMNVSSSTLFDNLLIVKDDEVIAFIPSSLHLTSVTLCLPKDSLFYISATKPCLLHIHSLDYSIHSILHVSIQPTLFSTLYSSLSSLEIALPSSSYLQWKELPLLEEQPLITTVPCIVFFRLKVKQPSSLLHIKVNPSRGLFSMIEIANQKIVLDTEVSTFDIVADSSFILIKVRCLQRITNQQLLSLLQITSKEQITIQELPFESSLQEDSFYNLFSYSGYHFKTLLQQSLHIHYDYQLFLPLSSISFLYHYNHSSSLLFHIYLSYSNSTTVLHNTLLDMNSSIYWNSFSLTLPSSIFFSSVSFSFELPLFSSSPSILLELKDLQFNSLINQVSKSNHEEINKEQPKPLVEKLQAIAKENEPLKKKEKKKTIYCKEEKDSFYSLIWKWTPAVTHVRQACPYGTGTLHRFCDSQGNWSTIDGKCKKEIQPDLLQQPFTRGSSSSSSSSTSSSLSNISQPSIQYCKENTIQNITFPDTLLNRTINVPCKHPLLGSIYRTCFMNGTWSNPIGKCSNCPLNSFAYFNRTTQITQCIECPSGTVFIRGNPLNPVKCYGSYYSEGGKTDCSLCKGNTRGNEKTGNFACKECFNGVIVGTRCMNTTFCKYQDKKIPIGQLVYTPCDDHSRGYRTQVCKYHSFSSSKLGPENNEGCCMINNPIPPFDSFLMEISIIIQNFHYSSLLHRYDQNKQLNQSKPIQLLQQIIQQQVMKIIPITVKFINYYDISTTTSVATRIHLLIKGAYTNNTDMMVFSYLKQILPDLTMQIKEMNPILYHYYVILKELELIWSSKNPSSCSAEGNWPITHIGETVKQACDNPFSIGYMKRTCKNENQRAVWSTVDDSLCEEKKNDSYYIYRIIYPKEKANKKKVSAFYERLLDQMNCDHLTEMTFIRFNSSVLMNSTLFRNVFKDCRIEKNRFIVTFSSTIAPNLDFIHFLFGFSRVEFITVIQEGLIARSSYVIQFTTWKRNDCPSSYLFCNLQHIVPDLYCHYNILS